METTMAKKTVIKHLQGIKLHHKIISRNSLCRVCPDLSNKRVSLRFNTT